MNYIIFSIVLAVIIGSMIYNLFFSKKAVINRKLKKAPSKKISEFTNGEIAKIVGTISPVDEQLLSPLSRRPCSYYFVLVEEKRSSGKNSYWKTIIEKEVSNKFLIKEGEHAALIDGKRVMSNIVIDKEYASGTFNDPPERLLKYLKDHGHEHENFFGFNKSIRYKEGILEEDEKVAVLGKGQWQNAAELGLPPEYKDVLLISAADEEHIYLSDDPETTTINEVKVKRERYNKSYKR